MSNPNRGGGRDAKKKPSFASYCGLIDNRLCRWNLSDRLIGRYKDHFLARHERQENARSKSNC